MCIFHKWTAWESKDVIFYIDFISLPFLGDFRLPKMISFIGRSHMRECVKCGKVQKKEFTPWGEVAK